jgi:hypothetical protein
MSQRASGYARQALDRYETPDWVTRALLPYLGSSLHVWEPAAASGQVARVLTEGGHTVELTDIETGCDFLAKPSAAFNCNAIITNPPYDQAQAFIEHALELMKPSRGRVAMLLRCDYDHAKTRRHLFRDCAAFACKLALTKRIVWFDAPGAAPSFNHAWFIGTGSTADRRQWHMALTNIRPAFAICTKRRKQP